MKNIIIFGGKGNGTVVLETIRNMNLIIKNNEMNVVGFVNNQHKTVNEIEGIPVLGDILHLKELIKEYNAFFINSISSVNTLSLVENLFENKFKDLNDQLISIVHPNAHICQNVIIGKGCFIGPQNYIGQNTVIGNHCFIHSQCYIARDSIISDYNYCAPKVYIGAEVTTEKSVYFGVGSLIKERVKIGSNAIIGMGSTVIENVKSKDVYYGEKAKKRN
jgi:sugar O-acyltransferase (sialic acid O-acetyltransferase NeuD family)